MASFTSTDNITNAINHIDTAIGIVNGELAKNNAASTSAQTTSPLNVSPETIVAVANTSSTSQSLNVAPETVVAVANTSPIKINVLLSFENANDKTNTKCRIVNEKPKELITTRSNEKWVLLELEYETTASKIVTTDFSNKITIDAKGVISTLIESFQIQQTDIDGIKKCVKSAIDHNNEFFIIENNYLKIKPVYVEKDSTAFKKVEPSNDDKITFKITPDVQIGSKKSMSMVMSMVKGMVKVKGSSDPKLKLSFDDEVKFKRGNNVEFLQNNTFTAIDGDVDKLNTMLEQIPIVSTKGGAKSKTKKGGRGRRRYKTQRR